MNTHSLPDIHACEIVSHSGLRLRVLNLGATLQSVEVPTHAGVLSAILQHERIDNYHTDTVFLGNTIGRYTNRIKAANFALDGKAVLLDANENPAGNCLHGGDWGFHRRYWSLERAPDGQSITCFYRSAHGECGFPGNLDVTVTYRLIGEYGFGIEFEAHTDRDTVVSLTNHAYFNLDLIPTTIDTHSLAVYAGAYTPTDKHLIPTGSICDVSHTRFDLREQSSLDRAENAGVFDHNFVLPNVGGRLQRAAELRGADGIGMVFYTTQPGLQVYTGEYLTEPFVPRQGLCLESQCFPDSPNQADFPSAVVRAGDTYRANNVYEFSVGTL
ncbi:MAG: aldose epimerase family protein [Pseudomonadota bacterium]